ncbi:MAG: hypothetical protein ACJAWH_002073 [Maribacter sp.]|jgi:hypothetical protein
MLKPSKQNRFEGFFMVILTRLISIYHEKTNSMPSRTNYTCRL